MTAEGAGYREIAIEPHPDRRLGFAEGSLETRMGTLSVSWVYEETGIRYELKIPEGMTANVKLIDGTKKTCTGGRYVLYSKA